MPLRDLTNTAIAVAKGAKLHRVETAPDHTDLAPQIQVMRGEDVVALIVLAEHEAELIVATASYAATAFDADALTVTFETFINGPGYERLNGRHPITGKRLESGDLADLAENHGGLGRGWVDQATCLQIVNRAGDSEFVILRYAYERDAEGRKIGVTYEDPVIQSTLEGHGQAYGYMYEAFVEAMTMPSMSQRHPQEMNDVPRDVRDLLAAQALNSKTLVQIVLMAREDDVERRNLLERFGETLGRQT